MLRKKEIIKRMQKEFKLASFKDAQDYYDKFIKIYNDGLEEAGSIKLEGIGIIRKVVKKAREINVPTKDKPVMAQERSGLAFKEDSSYKKSN